jgi:hypothetical protein
MDGSASEDASLFGVYPQYGWSTERRCLMMKTKKKERKGAQGVFGI